MDNRKRMLNFRVSPDELASLQAAAEEVQGGNVSKFVRQAAIERANEVHIDTAIRKRREEAEADV